VRNLDVQREKNHCRVEPKSGRIRDVQRYWEIIADNLSNAGWSWGCVSAFDCDGRTIRIADAHRGDGKRFVVHADEKLTAFLDPNRRLQHADPGSACDTRRSRQ